jgi:hypothetical protein
MQINEVRASTASADERTWCLPKMIVGEKSDYVAVGQTTLEDGLMLRWTRKSNVPTLLGEARKRTNRTKPGLERGVFRGMLVCTASMVVIWALTYLAWSIL